MNAAQPNFGKDLGIRQIDPTKIKLADDQITTDKPLRNPRTHLNPDEMANKRESIRTLGIIKAPLVRPIQGDPSYTHQMIAGSLRLRCVLKLIDDDSECYNSETAEWQPSSQVYRTIKCQVRECDEETAIRISIAENLEHTQVPELDLMEYCQELVDLKNSNNTPKYTRTQIADLCNRSESWVSLTLQLNDLPSPYKKLMQNGRLSRTGAISMVLGTEKDNFEKVIDECEKEVRREAEEEEGEAKTEERYALADLEDAEIDMGIHEMKKDEVAHDAAKKRFKTAQKRVSVASEKRTTAKKKATEGVITADTVNKVIMQIPGAKKGKAKPLTAKTMRELHVEFTTCAITADDERLAAKVAIAVLELALGKRTTESLEKLITNEKLKLEDVPTITTSLEEIESEVDE